MMMSLLFFGRRRPPIGGGGDDDDDDDDGTRTARVVETPTNDAIIVAVFVCSFPPSTTTLVCRLCCFGRTL